MDGASIRRCRPEPAPAGDKAVRV